MVAVKEKHLWNALLHIFVIDDGRVIVVRYSCLNNARPLITMIDNGRCIMVKSKHLKKA